MWNVCMRFRLMAFGLGVLAASTVVEAAVVSLKAVKKNDAAIAPTASLSVLPLDKIEAEIFLSGWAGDIPPPAGVKLFQVKIDGRGFINGTNGKVIPDGWCAPVAKIACTQSSECPTAYPICAGPPYGGCTCAGYNPTLGAFITKTRTDFIFNGLDVLAQIDVSNLNYRYSALVTAGNPVPDTGVARYLGTLVLRVSSNACGAFPIGFLGSDQTFINDGGDNPYFPILQPLVLTVPTSDCARLLVSCNPAHCNEDARIPHDRLDPSNRLNANTIVLNYSKPTAGMTAADFEMTVVPFQPGDIQPSITLVTPNGNSATVVVNRRIQQKRWYCFRDIGSDRRCCMGSLPGDVDNDRISLEGDMFKILDNLRGAVSPALVIEKCDTDRSGPCTPADLLMVVDLLNGADAFDVYKGTQLEVCPAFNLSQQ